MPRGKSLNETPEVKQRVLEMTSRLLLMEGTGATLHRIAPLVQQAFPEYALGYETLRKLWNQPPAQVGSPQAEVPITKSGETLERTPIADRKILNLEDELRNLRGRYKQTLREQSLAEKLVAETSGALRRLPRTTPPPVLIDQSANRASQDALALWSCLHFGEVVDPESTMGLGNYSPEVAAARMQCYVDSVLDLALNHHSGERIRRLWVVNVGDNVSGDIHEELKVTNAFPLGEQMVRCAYLIAMALRDLAAHFEEVVFVGVVGNHGRFEKKPAFKDKHNNADWVVYHLVQGLLADQENVKFIIPRSPWAVLEIQGHQFFFAHGDSIRSQFSFPWYDARKFTTDIAQVLTRAGQPYPEYWCFGQFHQVNQSQLSYGEWLFTGSFKGPDEYSLGKVRAGTPASQLFVGVHARRGVSFRYPVVLEEADPRTHTRYTLAADPSWSPTPNLVAQVGS